MSTMHDGGPAFPTRWPRSDHEVQDWTEPGMSLRDYFAAQAMTAIGRSYITTTEHGETEDMLGKPTFVEEARRCYAWADAMLAERAKAEGRS
jgi:hypothetical protein